jgi:hypothetical protein
LTTSGGNGSPASGRPVRRSFSGLMGAWVTPKNVGHGNRRCNRPAGCQRCREGLVAKAGIIRRRRPARHRVPLSGVAADFAHLSSRPCA